MQQKGRTYVKDSVDTQTRQALKQQDPLVHATATTAEWLQENRATAIRTAIIALVVIVLVVGAAVFYNARSAAAEDAFGSAMNLFVTPIAQPGQQIPPGTKTFANAADRAKAANPLFLDVANKYGFTEAGHNALYFAGLTYADMGDNGNAETYLKKAASAANANTSSLAKLALADLYTQSARNADAINLLQDLVKHPTTAVPAGTANLNLAAIYQTTDPAKAHEIYSVLKDKDTKTAAGEIAAQKLAGK